MESVEAMKEISRVLQLSPQRYHHRQGRRMDDFPARRKRVVGIRCMSMSRAYICREQGDAQVSTAHFLVIEPTRINTRMMATLQHTH